MSKERDTTPASDSRVAVIEAAIDTILERGYYRASSNEIARRAGVTWGVIQYHFGSRENLLLAALKHAIETHAAYIRTAEVSGETLAERLASFGRTLHEYYGASEFLAVLQIIVNLIHDPTTETATIEAMESTLEVSSGYTAKLLREAVAPIELDSAERRTVYSVMRGIAMDDLVLRTMHPTMHVDASAEHVYRAAGEALAGYLESRHGGRSGARRRRRRE